MLQADKARHICRFCTYLGSVRIASDLWHNHQKRAIICTASESRGQNTMTAVPVHIQSATLTSCESTLR